jgi:hypothetical protein
VSDTGPCAWPIDPACLGTDWDALDPSVQERAEALSIASLRQLTAYRVGGCPITVRPCVQRCVRTWGQAHGWPMTGWGPSQLPDGTWVNSCGCSTDCSCTSLCEVVLAAPVGPVSSVKVDGGVLQPSDYRVDGNRLVWTGGGDCPWPICQDMSLADTEVGTFSVSYLNAHTPDALAAYAAGVLAMEFAKACTGSSKCRLPSTVTSVARQGVSFTLGSGAFPDGLTGIREVDAFVNLWRPPGAPSRAAQVWFPHSRSPRVVG